MIKPRLRLYVCASAAAVTLGGAVLTQAAGPGEFISRLWKREPTPKKEVTPALSPFKWLRREKAEASARRLRVSDHGRRVVSERPSLVSDPFLTEQAPFVARTNVATKSPDKKVIARPEPRKKTVTTQTVDLIHPASSGRPYQQADRAGQTRVTDFAQGVSQNRTATAAQQPLPEVQPTSVPEPRSGQQPSNGQFVSGFDNEFQKLFKEVIEESRQAKGRTATPRLPDEAEANSPTPDVARLSDEAASHPDAQPTDFADVARKRNEAEVDNLIQESRNQIKSSVLARQTARDRQTTNVAGVSHSNPEQTAPRLDVTAESGVSGSAFMPQRLPDRIPQAVNQLIVPSAMVPERQLFTTSEDWMNRGDLERQAAVEADPGPDLQPVVRVVPGDRGAGVVIESGQWSPIQPRVLSNVAPARSVPDTSQFRRLSFEGSDATNETGAVQTIGDNIQPPTNPSINTPHAGQHSDHSAFMVPVMPDATSTVPPALSTVRESGEEIDMIIPDSRTGKILDAAELGAELAAAPEPRASQLFSDWPDESDFAAESPNGGFSWGVTFCFLVLTGGVVGLFFRRNAQRGAFVMTGTDTESEIS